MCRRTSLCRCGNHRREKCRNVRTVGRSKPALVALALAAAATHVQRPRADYHGLENVTPGELKETNTPGAAVAVASGEP